ncbi:uncharacterized protein PGTG_07620 [Puccinia graminis f. sp. tritici CRL 75-36-700-3]|uniref:Uncharacterized protein n=1 Tax=Puccinia graminis f. sp. tritici (strain CRL 75-36-700-3 / race SCCL) TaxID=418459 RepID=E3KCS1_PUCGT|nr:uncharacterized protein PGTG_07620 [Puccinia graminis f. sp. tritici CRL 75-36-700-3]EFP82223.1 hypothetical protein PGTG_07620 [Puccinia graminis f. sp. tritici CRL 75-36-700-3]
MAELRWYIWKPGGKSNFYHPGFTTRGGDALMTHLLMVSKEERTTTKKVKNKPLDKWQEWRRKFWPRGLVKDHQVKKFGEIFHEFVEGSVSYGFWKRPKLVVFTTYTSIGQDEIMCFANKAGVKQC